MMSQLLFCIKTPSVFQNLVVKNSYALFQKRIKKDFQPFFWRDLQDGITVGYNLNLYKMVKVSLKQYSSEYLRVWHDIPIFVSFCTCYMQSNSTEIIQVIQTPIFSRCCSRKRKVNYLFIMRKQHTNKRAQTAILFQPCAELRPQYKLLDNLRLYSDFRNTEMNIKEYLRP